MLKDYVKTYDFILQNYNNLAIDTALTIFTSNNLRISDITVDFFKICAQDNYLPFCDCVIHIEYNSQNNAKTKSVLNKYYEFLQCSVNVPVVTKLKTEQNDNKIKLCLARIASAQDDLMKCITSVAKTGKTPLQIKSDYLNGTLMAKEVSNV